jgi:hypothetical protein
VLLPQLAAYCCGACHGSGSTDARVTSAAVNLFDRNCRLVLCSTCLHVCILRNLVEGVVVGG